QVSRLFVLQVSDRLLTQGEKSFDPIANKNVLYVATDGIISLGYTGVAFLDGIPTDQWIAEKLTGANAHYGSRPGTPIGRLPEWYSVGFEKRALGSGFETVFSRQRVLPSTRLSFKFQIVVWKWGRPKRPRAFLAIFLKKKNPSAVDLPHSPRHIGRN